MPNRYTWILLLATLSLPLAARDGGARLFEFTYEIEPTEVAGDGPVDIYVPLPVENVQQQVLDESLASPLAGSRGVEATYGNRYYHLHRPAGSDKPVQATLRWLVRRLPAAAGGEMAAEETAEAIFLAPNRLVPVGHEILHPILDEIHGQRRDDSPAATARTIYDWVATNVEYKKIGTGWGNGDTFWACTERYGNCTDFHALFIALARTEGIPARFEIGFPLPLDRQAGAIGGYHCWVQFYLPGQGWIPIDASEAAKDPTKRELFFGNQPADRIHFSTGRDLVLSPGSRAAPVNYFIYPYAEVDGVAWEGRFNTRFYFREVAGAGEATASTGQ